MAKSLSKVLHANSLLQLDIYDAYLWFFWIKPASKSWDDLFPSHMSPADREIVQALVKRDGKKPEGGALLQFDRTPLQRWICVLVDDSYDMFRLLGLARQILKGLKDHACRAVLCDLTPLPVDCELRLCDALTAAAKALQFKFPKYSQKDSKKKESPDLALDLLCGVEVDLEQARRTADRAEASGAANNQLRHLVMQAGNDLTPGNYISRLKKLAEQSDLGFSLWTQKKLETMGAGAFLAVAKGSAHEDAGIVKLVYEGGGKKAKHLVLVGKGVTFDTGGHNLKPASAMYGMHRDMAGSALAYALLALAAKEKWPVRVTALLAIAENDIGPNAYRQNDVITALNGKTIEIVDTDAEGRMLLADTLHLACQEKPDLLLDFATLTGACIRAISTLYGAVFTNQSDLHQSLITAGRESGERVWPFPLEPDFAECLKSEIADTKQCRVSGGVDHIEAALFLKEFVGKDIPWVHLDLAAAENTGGLAHIDTEVTGFGVRFAAQFVRQHWGLPS